MMYMMKLKHGDQFGKKSSSTWRLLFVFILMPWLQKYRIINELGKEAFEKQEIDMMRKTIFELKTLNAKLMEDNDRKENESDGCLSYDDSLNQEYNHDDGLSEKGVDKESLVGKELFYSCREISEER